MSKVIFLIIVHFGGVFGLDQIRLVKDFRAEGIRLTVKKTIYLPDNTGLYDLKDIRKKFFILRLRYKNAYKKVAVHYLVKPFYQGGEAYIAGESTDGCYQDTFNAASMSVWEAVNSSGLDRVEQSYQACRHEVCHNLGCTHINTPVNIMMPDPLPLVGYEELPFLPRSDRQMMRCANE